MGDWLTKSFQQYSIIWLLISSILGGIIGASIKFIFDTLLPQKLTQKRDVLALKRKYSTPIILAADDLRKRFENMIKFIELIREEKWLGVKDLGQKEKRLEKGYYGQSTLYVVAQFLGWQQILRHEVVYLDFTNTKESRIFEAFLTAIRHGFSKPDLLKITAASSPQKSEDKWVYSFGLQAIGDAMIVEDDDNLHTIGFSKFCKQLLCSSDNDLRSWIQSLEEMFIDLKEDEIRFRRIVVIHSILNAFINYIDSRHSRTEAQEYHWGLLKPEEAEQIKQQILSINPKISIE